MTPTRDKVQEWRAAAEQAIEYLPIGERPAWADETVVALCDALLAAWDDKLIAVIAEPARLVEELRAAEARATRAEEALRELVAATVDGSSDELLSAVSTARRVLGEVSPS